MGKARPRSAKEVAGITFDAGALIALERGDRRMLALLREVLRRKARVHVPAGVVGQAWRGGSRQAVLSRFLASPEVEVQVLDASIARACGELCANASTSDVTDASVVICARLHGEAIVSSDASDLERLDPKARIERV